MKTKLIISCLLFISLLSFTATKSSKDITIESTRSAAHSLARPPLGNTDTTFLIGALDDGWDLEFERLDELGFNVWHKYIYPNAGWIWNGAPNDSLLTNISVYGPQVNSVLDSISSHNLKSIMNRPKIEMLTYGKRSDYQCEDIASGDLWFYSFQSPNHTGRDTNDYSTHGGGKRVRYMKHNVDDSGMVVSRLKANTEQCFSWTNADILSPIKIWVVKPRIRIDSIFVDNNPDLNVCRINVKNHNDSLIKSVILKGRNFRDDNLNYDGRYLEEFNNLTDSLRIQGFWGGSASYAARGNRTVDSLNKIDIQVYWYGNCDMWIDYVRVDNMVAHRLLSGGDVEFNNWLIWEADSIACHNESPIKFYMELFEFSNIPCMAYVSRKLDSIAFLCSGRHITLTSLLTGLYSMHVPWNDRFSVMNTQHIITNYVEKVGISDILLPNYPFYTNRYAIFPYPETFCKIPNTLPNLLGEEVLANDIPPDDYDDWLQDNLDHKPYYYETGSTISNPFDLQAHQNEGAFRWVMEMGDAISKAKDIPFLYNGQVHLYYYVDWESHREPTNEELDMLANVPLTYGARGLIYYSYPSYDKYDTVLVHRKQEFCKKYYGII